MATKTQKTHRNKGKEIQQKGKNLFKINVLKEINTLHQNVTPGCLYFEKEQFRIIQNTTLYHISRETLKVTDIRYCLSTVHFT